MNILLKPYPLERISFQKAFITSFLVAVFIGLFLYIFKPFNLHQYPYLIFASLLYSAVTFVCTFLVMFFIPRWFTNIYDEEKWTVIKEVTSIGFLLFLIGVGNFLLGRYLFDSSEKTIVLEFLGAQYSTVAIGIIPTIIAILLNQLRLEKENSKQAKVVEDKITSRQPSHFQQGNTKIEGLQIHLDNIIFAHAQGNYSDIYYRKENEVKKQVERITLTHLEDILAAQRDFFFRSHRSYLINLNKLIHVEGNAQGYRVQLKGIANTIPVSRSNINEFNKKINAE